MNTFLSEIPWPKLLYTCILMGILLLLAGEVYRLWFDREVRFADFQYFDNGVEKADQGKSFALLVADQHARLRHLFAEADRKNPAEDLAYSPRITAPIPQAESILSDVAITVQQVNVTDILSRLRRWVSTPVEITGSVMKSGTSFRASVALPSNSGRFLIDPPFGRSYRILEADSEDDLAAQVACSLIWAEAAKIQTEIQAVEREEFCHWTSVWETYLKLQQKHFRAQISNEDEKKLENAYVSLSHWIQKGITYPKYYQLRASLVELMTAEERQKRLVDAQNDRLRYAILLGLDPKKRRPNTDPLDEEGAYKALAEARPAIPYRKGKFKDDIPKSWNRLLEPASETIEKTAISTGWGRTKESTTFPNGFVGFLVKDNIVATVNYAIYDSGFKGEYPRSLENDSAAIFVFGNQYGEVSGDEVKIKKILRLPKHDGDTTDSLTLLEIGDYDKTKYAPLMLARDDDDIQKQVQSFVALIGFPAEDTRLPAPFLKELLKGEDKIKRVMPGRIVGFRKNPADQSESEIASQPHGVFFTCDVSSMGGTGGGPLVNLESRKVVGINHSGRWGNIREGKFAYAQSITLERIDKLVQEATKQE